MPKASLSMRTRGLISLASDFFDTCEQKSVSWYDMSFNSGGSYVE
ncbi:hypothetical protein AVEN_186799-1, partial [Araneus ventricosus]